MDTVQFQNNRLWARLQRHCSRANLTIYALIAALFISVVPLSDSDNSGTAQASSVQAAVAATCKQTRVAGHRGTSNNAKPNTMAAFREAVADGAQEIEFDLHRTKPSHGSGQWIVYHDAAVNGHAISKTSYNDLKKLDPSIITYNQLMQYLSTVPSVRALPEIKPTKVSKGSLKYIARVANKYGMRSRTTIQSFHKQVLVNFRKYNKGFRLAFIMNKVQYTPAQIRTFADAVIINQALIYNGKSNVASMHAAKLYVYAYTPNTEGAWSTLASDRVDGVITDYAGGYLGWCRNMQIQPPPTPAPVPTPPAPETPPADPDPAEPINTDPIETPPDPSTLAY